MLLRCALSGFSAEAERKAGDLLAAMSLHNGDPRSHDATRLSDLGITKSDSSRWQKLATIPAADAREMYDRQAKERQERLAGRHQANGGKDSTISEPTGKARDQAGKAVGVSGKMVDGSRLLLRGLLLRGWLVVNGLCAARIPPQVNRDEKLCQGVYLLVGELRHTFHLGLLLTGRSMDCNRMTYTDAADSRWRHHRH